MGDPNQTVRMHAQFDRASVVRIWLFRTLQGSVVSCNLFQRFFLLFFFFFSKEKNIHYLVIIRIMLFYFDILYEDFICFSVWLWSSYLILENYI